MEKLSDTTDKLGEVINKDSIIEGLDDSVEGKIALQIFTNNADAIKSEMDDHILVILNKVS